MRGHDRDINVIKWMPYSNLMVSGGADHLVGLWDAREGAMINRGIGHKGTVFGVSPALNGQTIASVDMCGEIKVWDVRKMDDVKPIYEYTYSAPLYSCGFDVSGSYLFVGSDDGKAQLFVQNEDKTIGRPHL